MRENRTSGLMRGCWKRGHDADCDTGSGTTRRRKPPETVKPCIYHNRASALLYRKPLNQDDSVIEYHP